MESQPQFENPSVVGNTTTNVSEVLDYDKLTGTAALLTRRGRHDQKLWDRNKNQSSCQFILRISLSFVHGVTLLITCLYLYAIHAKVDVSHPVFALVYQELWVLVVGEAVSLATVAAAGVDYRLYIVPVIFQGYSVYFHQWTWFVVSVLR